MNTPTVAFTRPNIDALEKLRSKLIELHDERLGMLVALAQCIASLTARIERAEAALRIAA